MDEPRRQPEWDRLIGEALSVKSRREPPLGFARRARARIHIQAALDAQRRRLAASAAVLFLGVLAVGVLTAVLAWGRAPLMAAAHHAPGLLGQWDLLTGVMAFPGPIVTALAAALCAIPLLLALLLWPSAAARGRI